MNERPGRAAFTYTQDVRTQPLTLGACVRRKRLPLGFTISELVRDDPCSGAALHSGLSEP
jgi:hypothetical protein